MSVTYQKISVITVTYNAAATILQTLESVFNQTYQNLEYTIIDGGSTDGTLEVINKYQHRLAYFVSEKDKGIYDAMNKGIKASKGDWIIFLGADDTFYNNEVLSKIFATNKLDLVDFIYGDVLVSDNRKIIGRERNYLQLIDGNISHQAIFYAKTIFNKIGYYNLKYKILADYDLNLRIFRDLSLVKKYVPEIISIFNRKGVSNNTLDTNFFKDQLHNFIFYENLPANSPVLQQYYFYYGFARVFSGNFVGGLRDILRAIFKGKRKIFFFLLTGKFFLSAIGVGKKIKVVKIQ